MARFEELNAELRDLANRVRVIIETGIRGLRLAEINHSQYQRGKIVNLSIRSGHAKMSWC